MRLSPEPDSLRVRFSPPSFDESLLCVRIKADGSSSSPSYRTKFRAFISSLLPSSSDGKARRLTETESTPVSMPASFMPADNWRRENSSNSALASYRSTSSAEDVVVGTLCSPPQSSFVPRFISIKFAPSSRYAAMLILRCIRHFLPMILRSTRECCIMGRFSRSVSPPQMTTTHQIDQKS